MECLLINQGMITYLPIKVIQLQRYMNALERRRRHGHQLMHAEKARTPPVDPGVLKKKRLL